MNTPSNPNANEATTAEPLTDVDKERKSQGLCYNTKPEQRDSWEDITAQIDYWRDLDAQYWICRKEQEYKRWLERNYNV